MSTKRNFFLAVLLVALAACDKEQVQQNVEQKKEAVVETSRNAAEVIFGREADDPKRIEQERFDRRWRELESFRAQQAAKAAQQTQQEPGASNVQFVQGVKEQLEGLSPDQINAAPIAIPITGDLTGPSVLKTQIYLDRIHMSPGIIDGRWGKNSEVAVFAFQRARGLDATGDVDERTFRAIAAAAGGEAALVQRTLTEDDVKGPFLDIPDDVYEQEKLDCMCYESVREKLTERFHATEELLARLNPGVDLGAVRAGQTLWVPNVRGEQPEGTKDIAKIVVSIAGNSFNAFDANGNLVFHAPTTIGSKYDPSPHETTSITGVAFDPDFHYQPKLYADVPDDEAEAMLKPGPNSPVGVVWMALKKPHYGIHGTSVPESIGYTSSHGCVRLTNWDALEVGRRVKPGVEVEFVDPT